MAAKMSPFRHLLPIAILLLLHAITAPASAEHSFDINPNPSPEASTSLICPNDNPSDCYPTLFQPSIHFQKILPNQSLPPGLHVRLNIQTGEKEARLNVPEEPEGDISEAAMIIDDVTHSPETALGVVDEEDGPLHLRLQDTPKQAKHARIYTPPRTAGPVDVDEGIIYNAALATIKEKSQVIGTNGVVFDTGMAEAFETLTELSHSIEWGITICRNADFVFPLLRSIFETEASSELEMRSAALLLLATAIQNNPDALDALVKPEEALDNGQELVFNTIKSIERDGALVDEGELHSNLVAREILFLSQICAHQDMTSFYLDLTAHDDELVEAFPSLWRLFSALQEKEAEGRLKLRNRIVHFVEDHVEDFVAYYMGGHGADDVGMRKQAVHDSLQSWCRALHSDGLKHGKDDSFGFLQAEQEVSRALETYTGKGCIETIQDMWLKEL